MRQKILTAASSIAVLLCFYSGQANATRAVTSIADATGSVSAGVGYTNVSNSYDASVPPNHTQHIAVLGSSGTIAQASTQTAGGGGVLASVIQPPGAYFNGGASASLNYYFEILGPDDSLVPVKFYIDNSVSTGGQGFGMSQTTISLFNGAAFQNEACADVEFCYSTITPTEAISSYFGEQAADPTAYTVWTTMVPTNEINLISLFAEVGEPGGPDAPDITAFGDPLISINEDYLATGNYTLVESGGIQNTAVPEPASWAMLLVGFGGLGIALRHHRRIFSQPDASACACKYH